MMDEDMTAKNCDSKHLTPLASLTQAIARLARARSTDEVVETIRVTARALNDAADLRTALRASDDNGYLSAAIDEAITRKPKGHDFIIDRTSRRPAVARHMSVTGG